MSNVGIALRVLALAMLAAAAVLFATRDPDEFGYLPWALIILSGLVTVARSLTVDKALRDRVE